MTPARRIVIVGGGTAGWLAANMLAHRWPDFAITLIEAPDIPTIGVGEGSTPTLRAFFETMGIAEVEWMPRCHATYKASIRFAGWSPTAPAPAYAHPFTTQLDLHTTDAFISNCRNRRMGLDVPTAPDRFLLNGALAARGKAPVAPVNFPFRMAYGYHFDAALLGVFLREQAVARGVVHREGRVVDAKVSPAGEIASVTTDDGATIAGDLFVDCSGFAALLIRGKLGVGFDSFRDNLFNDSAVVMPTPMDRAPPVETLATALSGGWCWSIPLTGRFGNGYVYSSDHLSADAAETELRAHLGLGDEAPAARHLRFDVGQLERHWAGNVLAVGLSQGFIEPLEATALHLVLGTVEMFMNDYERGGFTPRHAADFNGRIRERIERVRDYIVAHYKLNTRADTEYWQANRANTHLSAPLLHIFDVWYRRASLCDELQRQNGLSHFGTESWHCLFAGYGAFPAATAAGGIEVDFHAAQGVDAFLDGCSLNFPAHAAALASLTGAKTCKNGAPV